MGGVYERDSGVAVSRKFCGGAFKWNTVLNTLLLPQSSRNKLFLLDCGSTLGTPLPSSCFSPASSSARRITRLLASRGLCGCASRSRKIRPRGTDRRRCLGRRDGSNGEKKHASIYPRCGKSCRFCCGKHLVKSRPGNFWED